MTPLRGEVWPFDLGMAEKVRPVLVVSTRFEDSDRVLVTVIPHTTSLRGSRHEIVVNVSFLKPGAFLVQDVMTHQTIRAIRKLGTLRASEFNVVFAGLLRWLANEPVH